MKLEWLVENEVVGVVRLVGTPIEAHNRDRYYWHNALQA
jgi:hypothetical protein